MQSQVEELSPVLVEVSIEVPWDKVSAELDQAYRSLQKKAKVRGFRPGKVPRNVVKNLFGKSVRAEVTNTLVREGIGAAVEEHNIQMLAVPQLDEPSITNGEPLKFVAKIEVRPKIDKVDLDGIEVERVLEPVKPEAVEEEVERMRERNANLVVPDPPRPAQNGDLLTISLEATIDGERKPDMDATDTQVELGAGRLLEDMEKGLIGMALDETRTIEVSFPEDYGRADLQNKTASFEIQVKQMQVKVLPDLDDEFAKDVEFDTMKALRADVLAKLEATAGQRADALVREAVVEKMIDNNPMPVPPSLAERQRHEMFQELLQFQQMFGQGVDLGDDMQEDLKRRADRKVQAGLLFGEIARSEELVVSKEDIEAEFAQIAERTGKHIAKVRADHQGEQRERLEGRLLENKLLEYLLAKATIKDVTVASDAGPETKAAKKASSGGKKTATKKKQATTKTTAEKTPAKQATPKKKAAKKKAAPKKKKA